MEETKRSLVKAVQRVGPGRRSCFSEVANKLVKTGREPAALQWGTEAGDCTSF